MSHNITKEHLRAVKSRLEEPLKEVAKELGIDLKWGAGRYGENGSLKLELAALGDGGRPITTESKNFALFCSEIGLEPEDLYGTFTQGGETYRITGFNARAPKMPLQAERVSDGASMKFRADESFGKRVQITREEPAAADAG